VIRAGLSTNSEEERMNEKIEGSEPVAEAMEMKVEWKEAVYLGLFHPPVELAQYLAQRTNTKVDDVAAIILEKGVIAGLEMVAEKTPTKIDNLVLDIAKKALLAFLK
jgi:hypothetical protein